MKLTEKQISEYKKLRVAIVADELQYRGGALNNILDLHEVFPNSVVFTSIYEQEIKDKFLKDIEVRATFLQKMPFEKRFREEYFLLYPFAFSLFDFKEFDLVISISSAYSKFVNPKAPTKHILYCLTPPRYLWLDTRSDRHTQRFTYKVYSLVKPFLHSIWRSMDKSAARRADKIVAISNEVADRIKKFYELEPEIVYPSVSTSFVEYNSKYKSRGDWFLYLGRVEEYKGVEIMIRAVAKSKKKLKVAGKGAALEKMKELAKELKVEDNIEFLGFFEDSEKPDLLYNCKGLIFPVRDEDFGIVPVEANAAGCPVLAYKGGGVLETIVDGKTGLFFSEYSVESLSKALDEWDEYNFNAEDCLNQSKKFSFEVFQNNILNIVNEIK